MIVTERGRERGSAKKQGGETEWGMYRAKEPRRPLGQRNEDYDGDPGKNDVGQ